MTRKIAITARQVTALCKGAAKAGYIPEVLLGDVVVRLVPETSVPVRAELPASNAWDDYVPWPGPHLNHREERVLKVLVAAKGRSMPADGIPLAGPQTVKGLLSYGLVGLEEGIEAFDRSQNIHATEEGLSFFKKRDAHYGRHPSF